MGTLYMCSLLSLLGFGLIYFFIETKPPPPLFTIAWVVTLILLNIPARKSESGLLKLLLTSIALPGGLYFIWSLFHSPQPIYGITIIGMGGLCNLIVMLANKGLMPANVSWEKCRAEGWYYIPMDGKTKLNFLGDYIGPTSFLCSPGDILFTIGIYVILAELLY